MKFPDVERAVRELIAEKFSVRTVSFLSKDATDLVFVRQIPSNPGREPFLRTESVQVSVYMQGRDNARDLANNIREFLEDSPHSTTHGLLDRVRIQTTPLDVLSDSESINVFTATYSVDVRPIN